jgi:hypothetical protein
MQGTYHQYYQRQQYYDAHQTGYMQQELTQQPMLDLSVSSSNTLNQAKSILSNVLSGINPQRQSQERASGHYYPSAIDSEYSRASKHHDMPLQPRETD